MLCNQCEKRPQLVGDVRGCEKCVADRTANEIPYAMAMDTPLREAIEAKPGLANRFTREPPIADETPATDPEKPLKAPRRKK